MAEEDLDLMSSIDRVPGGTVCLERITEWESEESERQRGKKRDRWRVKERDRESETSVPGCFAHTISELFFHKT